MSDHDKRWRAAVATLAGLWVAVALWLVSPIDVLPDPLPFLGWLDDAALVLAALGGTGFLLWRSAPALTGERRERLSAPRPAHEIYEPLDAEEIRAL